MFIHDYLCVNAEEEAESTPSGGKNVRISTSKALGNYQGSNLKPFETVQIISQSKTLDKGLYLQPAFITEL